MKNKLKKILEITFVISIVMAFVMPGSIALTDDINQKTKNNGFCEEIYLENEKYTEMQSNEVGIRDSIVDNTIETENIDEGEHGSVGNPSLDGSNSNTIFVNDLSIDREQQDSSYIQDAIDAANPGDTVFISSGVYYEHSININKNITLIGEDKYTTIIDGEHHATIIRISSDEVEVRELTIRNSENDDAIFIDQSNNNTIKENIIKHCFYGIRTYSSNDNIISGNYIYDTDCGGIQIGYSSKNIICNNTIDYGGIGIDITYGFQNSFYGNTIKNFDYSGLFLWASSDNLFYNNNFINNVHYYTGENCHVEIGYGECPNTWFSSTGGNYWDDYLERYPDAINLGHGTGVWSIRYRISEENIDEIPLMHPYGSIINTDTNEKFRYIQQAINDQQTQSGHTIKLLDIGIHYEDDIRISKSIKIVGERRDTTIIDGLGKQSVLRLDTNGITISDLTVQNSGIRWPDSGVDLRSHYNTIANVNTRFNHNGIFLYYSSNNRNNITSNKYAGAVIWWHSDNNSIYHNNFIDNRINAHDECSNSWNTSYPLGGNHWSDYSGIDTNPYDGIGDTPYEIPGGENFDFYPYTEIIDIFCAYNPNPENKETNVDIDVTLRWSSPYNVQSHNVHLKTEDTSFQFLGNQIENFYTFEHLGDLTWYIWRIDEVYHDKIVTGEEWWFRTQNIQEIYVDDDYNSDTPGWQINYFDNIQDGIDAADNFDTVFVNSGVYYGHILIDKRIQLLGQDPDTTIIDGQNNEEIISVRFYNVTIRGFTIQNSTSSTYPPHKGIKIDGYENDGYDYIRIIGNKFVDLNIGISSEYSSNSVFSDNIFNDLDSYGIYIGDTDNSDIINNEIYHSSGILIAYRSSGNTISGNHIENNNIGIQLYYRSWHNSIFHNNFINNDQQAIGIEDWENYWDDGYPSGGNYWSDYEERYPDAEEIGNSGLWNTPYDIPECDDQDRYPLIEQYPI